MAEDRAAAPLRNGSLAVLAFTVVYLLLGTGVALAGGNQEFVFYIGVMVPILAAVVAIHFRVNFSTGVLWALSLWGLAHLAGGLLVVPETWPVQGKIRVLYSWWLIPGRLKYDHMVHAYGFGVAAWACWEGLRSIVATAAGRSLATVRPTAGMLTLCGAAGLGFGALNEVVEFAATILVPETNVGGYENTGWDLVFNLVGVLLSVGLVRLTQGNRGD